MTPAALENLLNVHEERLDHLQERQQGHDAAQQRVEDKIDGLKNWIMGLLVAAVGAFASAAGALLLFVLGKR